MDLILKRTDYRLDGVLGILASLPEEGPLWLLYTLEHAYGGWDGIEGPSTFFPKIPKGVYTCQKGIHRLKNGAPFLTFEVLKVPKHTGVLFHIGNVNADSEGCILVGMKQDPNSTAILQSRIAFKAFMDLQRDCETFVLTVLDG